MSHRDIVWITLESVREDHTSLRGDEQCRDTTPSLRQFAMSTDATVFSNCFSHGIWTRPSSASILTGRAPTNHRVLSTDSRLPSDIETIPAQLSDAGYRTVGVSPIAQVSAATGLDRGFDRFHYLGKEQLVSEVGIWRLLKYVANIRRHSAGFTTDTKKHCIGYLNTQLAKQYLNGRGDDPLFLYVHLGDSHHAYCPPKQWRTHFEDHLNLPVEAALEVALDMSVNLHEHIANGLPFDDEEWNAIEVLYDTVVAYVDSLAAEIVRTASERLEDPVIVVTADHGELFGERGCLAHMLVAHSAVSNVPLVVSGLDIPDQMGDGLVQHADVMEMISNDCDLPIDVPVGQDIRREPRSVAVTQRGRERAEKKIRQFKATNPEFDASGYAEGDLTSFRTRRYRYETSASGTELFVCPDESTDRSVEHPDVVSRLDQTHDEWLNEHGKAATEIEEKAAFSSQMQAQLRDLGYL